MFPTSPSGQGFVAWQTIQGPGWALMTPAVTGCLMNQITWNTGVQPLWRRNAGSGPGRLTRHHSEMPDMIFISPASKASENSRKILAIDSYKNYANLVDIKRNVNCSQLKMHAINSYHRQSTLLNKSVC